MEEVCRKPLTTVSPPVFSGVNSSDVYKVMDAEQSGVVHSNVFPRYLMAVSLFGKNVNFISQYCKLTSLAVRHP